MALKTNARNPLAYMGIKASTPPQLIVRRKKPTTADYQGFREGSFWVVPDIGISGSNKVWILTNISGSVANWIDISADGSLTIPGPDHSVLLSDGIGGINSTGPGTLGQAFVSQGPAADPAYGAVNVSGGGTGLTSIAAYNLLIGDGTNALKELAPSATSGEALLSQGAAADPAYGVVNVSGGGLGSATHTAYSTLCGGTTTTGNVQSVVGLGTTGQVLTSNGAGTLPTWQNISATPFFPGPNDTAIITQINGASIGTHTLNANTGSVSFALIAGGVGGKHGSEPGPFETVSSIVLIEDIPASNFGGAGSAVSYTIGAGGAGGVTGDTLGKSGGATSFGNYETAIPLPAISTSENHSFYCSAFFRGQAGASYNTIYIAPGIYGKPESNVGIAEPHNYGTGWLRPMNFFGDLIDVKYKGYSAVVDEGAPTYIKYASPISWVDSSILGLCGAAGGKGYVPSVASSPGSFPGGGGAPGAATGGPVYSDGSAGADGGIILIEYLM